MIPARVWPLNFTHLPIMTLAEMDGPKSGVLYVREGGRMLPASLVVQVGRDGVALTARTTTRRFAKRPKEGIPGVLRIGFITGHRPFDDPPEADAWPDNDIDWRPNEMIAEDWSA